MAIRLLIVDNEDLSRLRLRIFLEDIPDLATIDESRSIADARRICKSGGISVVIVKIHSRQEDTVDAIADWLVQPEERPCIILMVPEELAAQAAPVFECLDGLCAESAGPVELHFGVQEVAKGARWIDRALADKVVENAGGTPALQNPNAGGTPAFPIVQLCMSCGQEYGDLAAGARCPNDGAKLMPLGQKPEQGELLDGRFEILGFIEHGGMGDVYKAHDRQTKTAAAIKFLSGETRYDSSFVGRLKRESEVLKMLDHPNVVRFLGSGTSKAGIPFVAMTFEEGMSLETVLQNEGCLPLSRSIPIFMQVCEALEHAHAMGIIHRDLTPNNIFLVPKAGRDIVKLIDFGLSKFIPRLERSKTRLTKTGLICGTPTYMSPEQCSGKTIDERADIYALGCVMYETTAGAPPFIGASLTDTMRMHVHEEPTHIVHVESSLPKSFADLVMSCLSKQPSQRPQTASQIKVLLSMVEIEQQRT